MAQIEKAEVFISDGNQAVRIPSQFRLPCDEVYIHQDEKTGDVILSQSPATLREILEALHQIDIPDDFLSPEERAHAQADPPKRFGL